jgi:hypothetical protein
MADTTKEFFCAQCNEVAEHTLTTDHNQETVATCPEGHFVKFPAGADIDKAIEAHNEANPPAELAE